MRHAIEPQARAGDRELVLELDLVFRRRLLQVEPVLRHEEMRVLDFEHTLEAALRRQRPLGVASVKRSTLASMNGYGHAIAACTKAPSGRPRVPHGAARHERVALRDRFLEDVDPRRAAPRVPSESLGSVEPQLVAVEPERRLVARQAEDGRRVRGPDPDGLRRASSQPARSGYVSRLCLHGPSPKERGGSPSPAWVTADPPAPTSSSCRVRGASASAPPRRAVRPACWSAGR
jgi:hypothetical protein